MGDTGTATQREQSGIGETVFYCYSEAGIRGKAEPHVKENSDVIVGSLRSSCFRKGFYSISGLPARGDLGLMRCHEITNLEVPCFKAQLLTVGQRRRYLAPLQNKVTVKLQRLLVLKYSIFTLVI